MKKLTQGATRLLVLALGLGLATTGWAVDKTNPVTGETESYPNVFTGATSSEWNHADNWTLATESKVPFVSSGDYNAALVDGKTATSASTAIDGWQLRVGAYNGATVTWSSGIAKIQASNTGCWLTADENSSITIASFGNNQLEGSDTYPFKLSSAKAGGITWSVGLTGASNTSLPFWYYLKGLGTVVYGGNITVANAQVIKQADASLSGGSKLVESKDLITFGSGTTKAFTADASVSIKQSAATKATRTLKSVTAGGAPVKLASVADWQVGTCELVQTSTGVKLYYVDGDYDTSYMAYIGDDPTANRYYSVAAALDAIEADDTLPKKITLLLNTEEDIVIPSVGFVFDSNGKTIAGSISGASGVGLSESDGVYTGISNNAATWTGTAGDNLWSNAQNWSTKSVPTSATTVTFDTDATVEMGATAEIYGLVVNSGKTFTLYRTGNSAGNQNSLWATLKIGTGQVVGGGTVKLICAGISKTVGSFTINANIEFQNNGTYDSFLDETVSGAFTINGTVTGSGYLQVKTSTTFNGDVTIPSGSTIKVNSWTYNMGSGASLSGAGTLVFDGAAVQTSFKTALQDDTKWTGICELRNVTVNDLDLGDYGNENSYVCANGLAGSFKRGQSGDVTRVADGIKGLKLTGNGLALSTDVWYDSRVHVIAAPISGSGPINIGTQNNCANPLNAPAKIIKFVFTGDLRDFTGQVKFGATSYRPCYIFAAESDLDDLPTPTDYGQIIVMAGKTVNVGAEWSAPGGFFLNGVANVSNDYGSFAGSISGSGKVSYYGVPTLPASGNKQLPKNIPTFGSWSGDIEMQAVTISNKTQVNLSTLSADNRKLILKGINRAANNTSIFLDNYTVRGTVQVDGPVFITDGNSNQTYTWNKVTGSGNVTLTRGAGSASGTTHAITTLDDYSGTLETTTFALTIGTVNVSSLDLTIGDPIVKLATGCNLTTDPANIAVKVGNEETEHKLYKASDGHLYIKVASVTIGETTTYYPTLQAAADAAMAAGGETIQFTRIDSEASTSLPGWTYENGVFTRTGYAYNATTATEYASLASAVAAASTGDTIQLLYANSEIAVDTTDKDFVFDENGYVFSGSWTGSGRIVLSSLPEETTWASARFVSTGETIWTGTVSLDWENVVNGADLVTQLTKYGISDSIVEIGENGTANGWLNSNLTQKLKVTGTLEVWNGSTSTRRDINYVTGSGRLLFTHWYNNGGETTNYRVEALENWTGVITNTSEKLTITTISSGTGVIYTSKALQADPTASSGWQGRVVLDYANIVSANDISGKLNSKYGVSGSTVEIGENGTIAGDSYFNGDLTPNLKVSGFVSVNDGSSTYRRVIPQISGNGLLVFGNKGAQVNYTVSNLDNWDGIITNKAANVRFVGFSSGNGLIVHDWAGSSSPYILSGHAGSRVVINKSGSGHLASGKTNGDAAGNANFQGMLELAEGVTLIINNGWSGSNVTIGSLTGKGNLTVANTTHRWTGNVGYNIGTIDADSYSGTLTVGNEFKIGITKITRSSEPALGTPYIKAATTHADLASSSDGYFDVGSTTVEIAGEATSTKVVYGTIGEQSGLYKAVAQISTTYYATMQEAITAAGDNSLASITVLDGSAAMPDGYYIDNGVVAKCPAAIVYDVGDPDYYNTVQAAVNAANAKTYAGDPYEYVAVYANAAVTTAMTLKIKPMNEAVVTVSVPGITSEYALNDETDENGVVTYTIDPASTDYTWVTASGLWTTTAPAPWRYDVESTPTQATRAPTGVDNVAFASAADVTVGENVSVSSMTVSSSITLTKSTADVTVTATTGGIVLTDAGASVTVSGVTLSPAPTTTVANSYVKLTGSTYSVDTYKTVTFAGSNFSVAVTTNGQAVAVANNACTVEAGEISFTITPSSGYQVTAVTPSSGSVSGEGPYTYTVSGDVTITVTTAQESSVEIGAATFEYGVDFTNATVTVAVTETNASGVEYTLTVGAKDYTASAVGGTTVTFNNVEVPRGAAYGTVSYGITSTASATTGETSGSAAVADVQAGWINENATTHGQASAGGSWTNAVTYANGKAEISDNRFEAATPSTASRVVLEFNVCFSATNDADVDGTAQAAIKLGESGGATTFMVLASNAAWTPVSRGDFVPDASATYKVVMTIDYGNGSYGVTVGDNVLTNASGSASFPLAKSGATSVKNIDFAGSGTLTSMKGDQVEGYMVKDNTGHWYATIQAATQAYNSANGPYTVLHDGTAPSGWKIDETTKALIKLAKGFFFMAY